MFLSAVLLAVSININSISTSEMSSPDDSVTINASAAGLTTTTSRLQAIFTKSLDSPRYFSFSQNQNGEWYQYKSSPTDSEFADYYIVTASNSAWAGTIKVKFDNNSVGFKGAGDYYLRLKLYKSISSYSYSDPMPVKINWSESAQESGGTTTTSDATVAIAPEISWSLPSAVFLEEDIKIDYSISKFENGKEYYVKVRGAQTKNGNNYLSENEAWVGFPVIKIKDDGTYSEKIYALISDEKNEGTYKLKLRFRKKDGDTFVESGEKYIVMTKKAMEIVKPKIALTATSSATSSAWKPLILGTRSAVVSNQKPLSSPKTPPSPKNYLPYVLMVVGLGFILIPLVQMGREWYNKHAL